MDSATFRDLIDHPEHVTWAFMFGCLSEAVRLYLLGDWDRDFFTAYYARIVLVEEGWNAWRQERLLTKVSPSDPDREGKTSPSPR